MGYESYEVDNAARGIVVGLVISTIFWVVAFGIWYWVFG